MITTIQDYCQQRGVTKQFVYDYVRKDKFQIVDLPVFTEVRGERISGGMQKFLQVPEAFEPALVDFPHFDSQAAFVDYLTDYPELAQKHKAYFALSAAERPAYKAAMYADIAQRPEAERNAFHEAQNRLNDAMMAHMKAMQKHLKRSLKQAKKDSSITT